MVYHEVVRPVRLLTGETVGALVYVANQAHEQYAGGLAFRADARHHSQAVPARWGRMSTT